MSGGAGASSQPRPGLTDALQAGGEVPSPRLQRILTSLDLIPSTSILTCEAAASMDVEVFGERTEEVREWALHELAARSSWRQRRPAVPTVHTGCTAVTVAVAPALAPAACASVSAAAIDTTSMQESGILLDPSAAASAAAAAGAASSAAVLDAEECDIVSAVAEFLHVVPRSLLLHTSSALSDEERIAARRRHLISCGASSVRAGTAFVRTWIEFCNRRDIRDYGVPPDADLLNAFLADVDTAARSRAVHRSRQTGASVQHAMACAARWVTDHAGLPFDIAKSRQVRKASAPAREVDPGWSAMWEPAILVHLLRVALHEQHRGLVRAMAAAAYFVCAASMRLINGLRSGPPILDSLGVFHGVAALSKGRRRSTMAPRPWAAALCFPA
ncbi:hypothetical protein AB1Y20_011465 [Prymnesium parvum]|uniref:Uncharacterized protein n=1 Tax=Prymnesium parvum TaxID=97485 RepID=A0AB34IPM5_PRYPA